MKCPSCNKNKAIIHPQYGITECEQCQHNNFIPPKHEFTSDSIIDQRREYKKDIIHPFRDGLLSKEYIREYGTSGIDVTPKEIKNAKEVWGDVRGKWNIDKSKGGRSEGWKEQNIKNKWRKT